VRVLFNPDSEAIEVCGDTAAERWPFSLDLASGVARIELDGALPLNTFGGSLSAGRIHGLWQIIEGALQASGRAGERQVKDVKVSFVGASAPIVQGTTFIFVNEPY